MRVVSALRNVVIVGSLLGLQAGLSAQQANSGSGEAAEQAPDVFSFNRDKHARMTVPVSVAGRGPYPFLVDTGAERTVISKELASQLKLDPGKSVTVHSMTDVSQVATAVIPHLGFSKRSMREIHAPAFAAAHLGAAGMLGVDSLQSQRVTFDFGERTMSVAPARKQLRDWGPEAIVIKGRSLYGRLVMADAEVEGQKVLVVLDTGSQVSIGNEALKRKLTARRKLPPTTPIELLSVTGNRLTLDYTSVRRIRLGGILINDMPIGFGDVHPFRQLKLMDRPALLLGMDALQLFDRVSVDFARRQVRFLPDESTSKQSSGNRLASMSRRPATRATAS